ncbi:hypothetical protein DN387_06260 [Pseudomonas sp. FBF18]|nr:hypothetical protein [Pseudomonas sp. FBF18]MCQ0167917.1 hypothetical protein [Pseudomonas sp. S12(2018)]
MDCVVYQAGHQYRSLAALNALALRTGVIVFLTIPTSRIGNVAVIDMGDRNALVRWSGLYTLSVYKN